MSKIENYSKVFKDSLNLDDSKFSEKITPFPETSISIGPNPISMEIVVGFTVIIPLSSTVPFTWEPLKSIKRILRKY